MWVLATKSVSLILKEPDPETVPECQSEFPTRSQDTSTRTMPLPDWYGPGLGPAAAT